MAQPEMRQEWPPIDLAWRQRVAAFWSISWPCWLAWIVIIAFLPTRYTVDNVENYAAVLSLLGVAVFFVGEGLLIRRLLHKRYRSFYILATPNGEDGPSGKISTRELLSIWLRVIWPQTVFLFAISLIPSSSANRVLLGPFGQTLIVGPIAIQIMMKSRFRSFRIQAYGQRYI